MDGARYAAAMDASTDPRVRALVKSGPGLRVTALLADRNVRNTIRVRTNGIGYASDPLTGAHVEVIPTLYPNSWSIPVTDQPQTFVTPPGGSGRFRSCHGCGVPGDCYCHEGCDANEPASLCNECTADWQTSRNDDHRDAIAYAVANGLRNYLRM